MERVPFAFIKQSLLLIAILLPLSALAQTGADRIGTGQCPEDAEAIMVYSPFKPYFAFETFKGNRQKCWTAADCLFEAAGESRKQQFAATALVMGLIPLTLKDIAWPERRLIHVTERLNVFVEILVLALGLVPSQTGNRAKTRKKNVDGNLLAAAAWGMSRPTLALYAALCALGVVGSYAGLVIMEAYSKRSALGCPVPIFVAAWYVVALVPAGIHSLFAAFRRSRYRRRKERKQAEEDEQGGYLLAERAAGDRQAKQQGGVSNVKAASEEESERKKKIISAVQGADEDWPVQMAWGVYYIAGTLIFTSIMAVTVIELIVWVALGFAVTGSSKVLAFFLCMVFEETGKEGVQRSAGGVRGLSQQL